MPSLSKATPCSSVGGGTIKWAVPALCSGLRLSFSPAIFAEEVAVPEIAIYEIAPDAEIVDGDDVVIDDEVEIIDEETTTDEEVVIDKEMDGEVTDDDGVVICRDHWIKRGEGGEEIYYMSANGGPGVEPNRNNASDTAPVEADKDAAVTTRAEKSPKVNTVQRNSAKPNAVKSNGRVFLRK
jgi:hypothetical protein